MNPVRVELRTGRARAIGGPTLELNATLERLVHRSLNDVLRSRRNQNSIEELRQIAPDGHWMVRAKKGNDPRTFQFIFNLASIRPVEGTEAIWVLRTAERLWKHLDKEGFLIP